MRTAIIIAGMHRSGTSATTGALRLAGVSLGEGLLEAAADNPKGYFESEQAVRIHEKLLADLGSSWDDVRELPAGWMSSAATAEAKGAIHRLIETEFANESLWAIKDPRICRFIPLWREVLDRVAIRAVSLHVVRRPDEVAASISARNGWARQLGELLWMRHVFEAEASTRDMPRAVLSYESLLRDPSASIDGAMGQLGIAIDVKAQIASNLSGFVDTKDRHHAHQESNGDVDQFSALMNAAYERLVAIEQGSGDWQPVQEIAQRAHDWLQSSLSYVTAVAAKAARHHSDFLDMEVRNYELQSALNAQIEWSNEAAMNQQRLMAQLEAKTAVQVAGGAELLGTLQQQATSLAGVLDEVVREREILRDEHRQLHEARASQQTISHLEAANASLVAAMSDERKQWASERVLLDAERAELEAERDQSQVLLRELRVQNEVLTMESAKLSALVADGEQHRSALTARNVELETNESHLGEAVRTLTQDMQTLTDKNVQLNEEVRERALKMEAINRSRSWRLTRPLRVVANYFRSKLGRPRALN